MPRFLVRATSIQVVAQCKLAPTGSQPEAANSADGRARMTLEGAA